MKPFEHICPLAPRVTRILRDMALTLVFLFLPVTAARANAMYDYYGNPLVLLDCPECYAFPAITGSIVLPSPLPDGSSSYHYFDVISFTFSWNLDVVSGPCTGDDYICGPAQQQDVFNFTTANGRITKWSITASADYGDGVFYSLSNSISGGDTWAMGVGPIFGNFSPGRWVSTVPEPGSGLVLMIGAVGLIIGRKWFNPTGAI